jgi:hypothetical protein
MFLPNKLIPAKVVGGMSCSDPILPDSLGFLNCGIKQG